MNKSGKPKQQTKSRQNVFEHGEVFTNKREVKAMCDLVKDETECMAAFYRLSVETDFPCLERMFKLFLLRYLQLILRRFI